MTKNLYGFQYETIPTEVAKANIANDTSEGHSEVGWYKVATLDNGDTIWIENYMGNVLVLTEGETSYVRCI
jgi:hypothetical protein